MTCERRRGSTHAGKGERGKEREIEGETGRRRERYGPANCNWDSVIKKPACCLFRTARVPECVYHNVYALASTRTCVCLCIRVKQFQGHVSKSIDDKLTFPSFKISNRRVSHAALRVLCLYWELQNRILNNQHLQSIE